MSQSDPWPQVVAGAVGEQVKRWKRARKMSTQELAEALQRYGIDMNRPVLSNLENGRRGTVSVAELLALGAALRVPPMSLLFPLDRPEEVEALPGVASTSWHATLWATGEKSETHTPLYDYYDEVPSLVTLFRRHDAALASAFSMRNAVIGDRETVSELEAGTGPTTVNEDGLEVEVFDLDDARETLRENERREAQHRKQVARVRERIRERGVAPPVSPVATLLGPWPDDGDDQQGDAS